MKKFIVTTVLATMAAFYGYSQQSSDFIISQVGVAATGGTDGIPWQSAGHLDGYGNVVPNAPVSTWNLGYAKFGSGARGFVIASPYDLDGWYLRKQNDSGWQPWRRIITEDKLGFSVANGGIATFIGQVSAATGSNGGFQNSTYGAGHNNIWRFGNAAEYGMAYYQGTGYAWGTDAIGFHFGDRNSPKFYVQDNGNAAFTGNVGIGTSQTNSNLYVYGTIKSKEVKVEATVSVPDYVFEKSYNLKSLVEVEKYIKENKHLPEIPSAKVIEKEGMNVGEMQLSLLKKIEELTLYLIEQNKRLERQDKEGAELKLRMKQIEMLITEANRRIDASPYKSK